MKKVQIGNVTIGGGEKIAVQSMTNVKQKITANVLSKFCVLKMPAVTLSVLQFPTLKAQRQSRKSSRKYTFRSLRIFISTTNSRLNVWKTVLTKSA